ncbi:TetR/AcrR family transcriptional regulator [Mycolicibacterium sp. 018/SC-01/001]|uniref:TetR/AcrR family transcriptional regulator n=1 Tax=Mycolicibacterium sp. 018/SC-01/001 TaxID=2592069 RepID=UPI00117D30FB|nr:TetR/AcrR family transcriptional regulator [Mycolicibacterium sp. 018/SC-01/001]TRW82053.1 TetR/AcrR family transcriptional regulator [Mycolicibacterium sp. 018/SC-01/001]
MRRHGWSGDIPRDDEEAASRIIEAARRAIDDSRPATISSVAQTLGITRQTVYRYFPTQEVLLAATALSSIDRFLDQLAAQLGDIRDPTHAVVEGIAYTLEQLSHDRYLRLVVEPGKASAFTAGVTSEVAIGFGRSILERFDIDWPAAGFEGEVLNGLVEFMLRTLQSFIIDPGGPGRHGEGLRAYLYDWVAPAVRARAGTTTPR